MLCGVVGIVGDDGVCDGGFPVDGCFYFVGGFVNVDVEMFYGVVSFDFRSEIQIQV